MPFCFQNTALRCGRWSSRGIQTVRAKGQGRGLEVVMNWLGFSTLTCGLKWNIVIRWIGGGFGGQHNFWTFLWAIICGQRLWRVFCPKCFKKFISVIQSNQNRILATRSFAKHHCLSFGKRGQRSCIVFANVIRQEFFSGFIESPHGKYCVALVEDCLLYTSDAADDLLCVDLGG